MEEYVQLVDFMPRENLDQSIVDAARVSTGSSKRTPEADKKLLRYLMRHYHTSPFEMVEFKFKIKMPIYLARQHMRHRTASINEISGRYSKLPEDFGMFDEYNYQSPMNHQGGGDRLREVDETAAFDKQYHLCKKAFDVYDELIDMGVAKEQARAHLPLNTYTTFIWKVNLHNLLHYIELRIDPHAQREIREYAQVILDLVEPLVPWTIEAWRDYRLRRLTFTGADIDQLKGVGSLKGRELQEFDKKIWVVYDCYRYMWYLMLLKIYEQLCSPIRCIVRLLGPSTK